jgi:hypothetical protein
MLPARLEVVSDALVRIDALRELDRDVLLQVGLLDGTVHEGSLVSATSQDLAIRMKGSRIVNFGAEEIRSLALGKRRRGREWALAGVGIAGAVATFGGLVSLPLVGDYLRVHSEWAFQIVIYVGLGTLIVLLSTTRLRQWLTKWEVIVEDQA